jgi:soluble lytic murein transglycosylase
MFGLPLFRTRHMNVTRRRNRLAFLCAAIAILPAAAFGASADRKTAPFTAPNAAGLPVDDTRLKAGLEALAAGEIGTARAARDGLPEDGLDRHILAWAIAMSGSPSVPSADIAAAARMLPGWPGALTLRKNSERAFFRENPDPLTVVGAYGVTRPLTLDGVILLARAHVATGNADAARAVLSPFWRSERLEARSEARIIREFGRVIPGAVHRFRMERMLYAERVASARRVARLAGAEELAEAWAAVIGGDKKAAALLAAVPPQQRSAGYLFAEAKHLRRQKKFAEAAEIMMKAPRERAALVDPDAWWVERRVLSREFVDLGDMKTAYRLAAAHSAESPASAADAEFHAGWYALRGLSDAGLAARHFSRLAEVARGPISLSRAWYWLGRTAEAGGPGDAQAYFRQAAAHGTTFYGQLAAQRTGAAALNVAAPEPSAADRVNFAGREAVRAIGRLEECGQAGLAGTLHRALAAEISSPGELALLTAMAERRGNHFLALKVGKIAASLGIDVGSLSHPVGAIPAEADFAKAGEALAYAIARQESEFNVGAVSGAGARGLLQLMPGTAREVARKAGLPYSPARLTSDAAYNATLGSAFLGEQLGRFDGSYLLTFVGYNAGPRRALEWIRRYGDPRGKDIDTVVDWIEHIPFTETRGYVQRVMENYQVYKMRLAGRFDIVGDLVDGR